MIVVLPYADSDAALMFASLEWMAELGGCKGHDCLLLSALNVGKNTRESMRTEASEVFSEVFATQQGLTCGDESWPKGANILFDTAMHWMTENSDSAWLWNEADCVPLKRGWLDLIETEYRTCGKPFMGPILKQTTVFGKLWPAHMPGNGIYPNDTAYRLAHLDLMNASEAFDLLAGETVAPCAHHSKQFCHIWGSQEPPNFVDARKKGDPVHYLTLDQIPKSAVHFHRSKDSSLRDLLRQKGVCA